MSASADRQKKVAGFRIASRYPTAAARGGLVQSQPQYPTFPMWVQLSGVKIAPRTLYLLCPRVSPGWEGGATLVHLFEPKQKEKPLLGIPERDFWSELSGDWKFSCKE
jgi:hypothetical protein